MRKIVGLLGLVAALAGCGGTAGTNAAASPAQSSTSPATSTPPTQPTQKPVPTGPNVSGCFTEADGKIFTHGDDLPGVIAGKGAVGVVITYERRGNVCSWRPISDRLVAAGYRVLLYARTSTMSPLDTTLDMAERLGKEKGVERVFLMGGSIGATVAATAALELDNVAGVVALSGEIDAADAAKLTVPLLQVGSEHDSYGGADDLRDADAAASKSPAHEVMVVEGESMHASVLFGSPHGPAVLDRIVTFMDRHKG
ncbi:hypothetical protein HII36_19715 [Nonomuraea sp. NN258]|uniref:alpha/beta hydrolase n=1 Tax=Nonomuraea antri TaxID=2730852 RepID=UPI001568A20E|nr:hypothetical protein [Nonomuraea antri]NRQ34063.1 hypothetical protein [Nonomuraea antri]